MSGIVSTSIKEPIAVTLNINVQVNAFGTYHFKETVFLQPPSIVPEHENEAVIVPANTSADFLITAEPQESFY